MASLAVAGVGCGGGDEVLQPETLAAVASSNNQSGPVGSRLAVPLAVQALTADGRAAVRARVTWAVLDGGGALSDTVTIVNGNGIAVVEFVLPATAGVVSIGAAIAGQPEIATTLMATAQALGTVDRVEPPQFAGGDTVALIGTGLAVVDRVDFGLRPGLLLSAADTRVEVVAPICRPDGPVNVTASSLGAHLAPVSANFVAGGAAAALTVGQFVSLAAGDLGTCANFAAAGPNGAEFIMTVQSATGDPGVTSNYRLAGDSVVPPTAVTRANSSSSASRFHDFLRHREMDISQLPVRRRPPTPEPRRVAATVGEGDKRNFRVCNKIGCNDVADFTEVKGVARFVGDRMIIYEDQNSPAGFTDQDFASFGSQVENDLYVVATNAFGSESDVDGNGRVVILLTPVVNGLTPASECASTIFTGFFFGVDIDPAFENDDRSNQAEVFYALTPDPSGTAGCNISTSAVRQLVPVTFVHELQHMISYNQHRLVRGGSKELLWLDEALSHLSEELAGRFYLTQGDNDRFSQFAVANLVNSYLYLESPASFFALPSEGTGALEERGASWLFLRWVLDRVGAERSRALVETDLRGAANIEAVVGEDIEDLLSDWSLAAMVSDLPDFAVPERLSFEFWRLRNVFAGFHDQSPSRFPLEFPIVPIVVQGGVANFGGTLRSGSADFFRLLQGANAPGFVLSLDDGAGGVPPAQAAIRLNIVRIR